LQTPDVPAENPRRISAKGLKQSNSSMRAKLSKTRLEDLAQLAGVSITTVSRALNDSPAVNSQTKQQIWKLAREHNYPFRGYMPV
jgi:transcriptional regulator with XRE-family HTH domain